MMLCKKGMDEYTMGIRVSVYKHERDKYECKIHELDEFRTEIEIGLPENAAGRWAEGIGFVIRTLWCSKFHCAVAIDYDQWCQFMPPEDIRKLDRCLPDSNFCIRVYNVPAKSPLRQSGGEYSDVVQKAYRKKRGYIKHLHPDPL